MPDYVGTNLARVQEALKSFYLDGLRYQLNDKASAFLAQIEKTSENVVGKDIVMALRYGRTGGIGNRADDGLLPSRTHSIVLVSSLLLPTLRALRYARATRPDVLEAVTVNVDERRKVAVCEVSDTGAGIPVDDLPKIFDKFYRVRANEKMAKGTGLGLALVKHIVETVHDGKLTVTSEEGKGSTFAFELPIIV